MKRAKGNKKDATNQEFIKVIVVMFLMIAVFYFVTKYLTPPELSQSTKLAFLFIFLSWIASGLFLFVVVAKSYKEKTLPALLRRYVDEKILDKIESKLFKEDEIKKQKQKQGQEKSDIQKKVDKMLGLKKEMGKSLAEIDDKEIKQKVKNMYLDKIERLSE